MMEVDQIQGVTIGVTGAVRTKLVALIGSAAAYALDVVQAELPGRPAMMAVSAAAQSINGLLSVASVKCHLGAPPEDIEARLNSSGRIVYRCYHDPAHEWDLTGNPLP